MSDTFREWLVEQKEEAELAYHATLGGTFYGGKRNAFSAALTEYDHTAPDRERAERALRLVEEMADVHSAPLCENYCPIGGDGTTCYGICHDLLQVACRLGILTNEAHNA